MSSPPSSPGGPPSAHHFADELASLLFMFLRSSLQNPFLCSSLSTQFRAALLIDENWHDFDISVGSAHSNSRASILRLQQASTEGVPLHPLYKHLAHALCAWMETAGYPRRIVAMPGISEHHGWKEKLRECSPRVVELVTLLKQLMQTVKFQLQVQEPFFSQLQDGSKTVEGRCRGGAYDRFATGDLILVNKTLLQEVKGINCYSSFKEMLVIEGLDAVLPGVSSISEGVAIYRRFYAEEKERSRGVLAIHVQCEPKERQPFRIIESILEVLSIGGVSALMGFHRTAGSVMDSLPPARSVLLASFVAPNRDDLSGSKLTVGGRALAKHVHRSASGWWGHFIGNDESKNEQALNIITYLIQHACWMNVHCLPPDSQVFELRVKEGYGARWSSDGTKFRGYLEPNMEDGHAKKWRH